MFYAPIQMRERRVEQISVGADFDEREEQTPDAARRFQSPPRKDEAVEHYPSAGDRIGDRHVAQTID